MALTREEIIGELRINAAARAELEALIKRWDSGEDDDDDMGVSVGRARSASDLEHVLARCSPLPEGEWLPTSEHINALPEPIRQYIHDLETRCDPSGDIRELAIARDTIRALEARVAELEALPEGDEERGRVETGPVRMTPDDWPGVFIRGDDAAAYAAALDGTIRLLAVLGFAGCDDLLALKSLLASCEERSRTAESEEPTP